MKRRSFKIIFYCLVFLLVVAYLIAESMFADLIFKNIDGVDKEEVTVSTIFACITTVNAFTFATVAFILLVRLIMLFQDITLSELPKLIMLICLFLVLSVLIALIVKYSYIVKYCSLNIKFIYDVNEVIYNDSLRFFKLIEITAGIFIAICALMILRLLKFTIDVGRTDFSAFEDDLIEYIKQIKAEHKDSKIARLEREIKNLKDK